MSIVGPRPQRPEFFDELSKRIPFYPHRLRVLPGMTGWSQVQMRRFSGPLECTVELEYDLYYLKYFSLRMDLFAVLQALKNVLLWGGRPSNIVFDDR
jgi:lipopolysaccharide/colanic/teichoic acid biosynthesis glycosyltransferase